MDKYSPHPPRHVRRGNESQYEDVLDGNASLRRALYPYEKPPWEDREPYNIWADMATYLVNARRIVDLGTNDGYFHAILRHEGFNGWFTGIDIEGKGMPAVEYIARLRYKNVEFVQGDAQDLRGIVEDSSTDAAVAAFLGYHAAKPGKILSELHRILEPGGTGIIASRDVTNQEDTWRAAQQTAHHHGFAFPQEIRRGSQGSEIIEGVPIERISVYSHFDISQTRQSLRDSKKFRVIHEHIQDSPLWIPMTEVGLAELEDVIESLLPYTRHKDDGHEPTAEERNIMYDFIHSDIREDIIRSAKRNQIQYNLPGPYHISRETQGFFVVEAVK